MERDLGEEEWAMVSGGKWVGVGGGGGGGLGMGLGLGLGLGKGGEGGKVLEVVVGCLGEEGGERRVYLVKFQVFFF